MNARHFAVWPKRLPYEINVPQTNLASNLATAAERYPNRPAIVFYDTSLDYARVWREVESLAGYLERNAGVRRGDRVVLSMQNSPQWIIGYYAILRANAVVVPLNPMLVSAELKTYVADSGATAALVGAEVAERFAPYAPEPLRRVVVATYSDYLERDTGLDLPAAVAAPRTACDGTTLVAWHAALAAGAEPSPIDTSGSDVAILPYTSGTTGVSKGCVHTHLSAQTTAVSCASWINLVPGARLLSVLPYFHVTGQACDMNAAIFAGAALVVVSRWDARTVLRSIERYRCTGMTAISTMIIDLLQNPAFSPEAIASLRHIGGGGAALPAAVGEELASRFGLQYMEGYGLTETIAMTHANPPDRTKRQCLGIPTFGVDSRVIDVESQREAEPGQTGEIVISGTQVMREYWRQPEATADAFIELDGKRFLRTGDLGFVDDEGYFIMVDRVKRMINASGFKVWPAEVEAKLFAHPAVAEACVIARTDPRRGETPKALIVLKPGAQTTADEIVAWSREQMAPYKVPTAIEFVAALPRSGTGKVAWRELQQRENEKVETGVAGGAV